LTTAWRIVKAVAALSMGIAMLYLGYRFFAASVALLEMEPPHATAGLMAGLAGFTFTAAAVTVVRDWIILERLEEQPQKRDKGSSS
jgi:hypothetical protein